MDGTASYDPGSGFHGCLATAPLEWLLWWVASSGSGIGLGGGGSFLLIKPLAPTSVGHQVPKSYENLPPELRFNFGGFFELAFLQFVKYNAV